MGERRSTTKDRTRVQRKQHGVGVGLRLTILHSARNHLANLVVRRLPDQAVLWRELRGGLALLLDKHRRVLVLRLQLLPDDCSWFELFGAHYRLSRVHLCSICLSLGLEMEIDIWKWINIIL